MAFWKLDPDYAHLSPDFGTLQSVFTVMGERVTKDAMSDVIRVNREGVQYYVKRYWKAGSGLRRYVGRPRVRAEWQNLQCFERWGIPTAHVVAWGLEREWGTFRRGALITRELPDTEDLLALVHRKDPRFKDAIWVNRVSQQVARATRIMHDNHFTHNDLKWRNLLVNAMGDVFFIDCPTGAFWYGFLFRYRKIKDLACLDKVGRYQLSRTQRLRFYLHYTGRNRLAPKDKRIIRKIEHFFRGRE